MCVCDTATVSLDWNIKLMTYCMEWPPLSQLVSSQSSFFINYTKRCLEFNLKVCLMCNIGFPHQVEVLSWVIQNTLVLTYLTCEVVKP